MYTHRPLIICTHTLVWSCACICVHIPHTYTYTNTDMHTHSEKDQKRFLLFLVCEIYRW